jgi:sterol desaturase/sphingolipid hydroxylase (fatty acid hydroxylase superfamily)
MIINTYITVADHSGYHFPLHHSPEFHYYHHQQPTENFGSTGWLDTYFG